MNRLLTGTLLALAGGTAAAWLKARRDEPALDARTRDRLAPRNPDGSAGA